jgi:hypothetical protein
MFAFPVIVNLAAAEVVRVCNVRLQRPYLLAGYQIARADRVVAS